MHQALMSAMAEQPGEKRSHVGNRGLLSVPWRWRHLDSFVCGINIIAWPLLGAAFAGIFGFVIGLVLVAFATNVWTKERKKKNRFVHFVVDQNCVVSRRELTPDDVRMAAASGDMPKDL